jgi:hypothetical protein
VLVLLQNAGGDHGRGGGPEPLMRCFTDDQIRRGLTAVIAPDASEVLDGILALFLKAANEPTVHPMHCALCRRQLTDTHGTALVAITITDQWMCATCP